MIIEEKNSRNPYFFGIAVLVLAGIALIFFISYTVSKDKSTGQNRNVTKEIKEYEDRLASSPSNLETILKLAHLYLDDKQYDKSAELYEKVLQVDPKNVEAVTHLGSIEEGRQNINGALEKYDEALKMQPDYAHALWDKAVLMRNLGRYEESIALFERFLKVIPTGSDAERVTEWLKEMKTLNQSEEKPPSF